MEFKHSNIDKYPDKSLREYQQKAKSEILNKWDQIDSLMLQMPTGTGKTFIFASLIRTLYAQHLVMGEDCNILAVVHRKELVEQICDALAKQRVPYGIIQGNTPQNLDAQVQVASIQSVLSKRNAENVRKMGFNYIIIDEAHHSLAESYKKLFLVFPLAKKLGVTATPWRLNHESFTKLYQDIIISPSIKYFINNKYLSDFIYISIKPDSQMQRLIDETEISFTGDFDEKMLEYRFDQKQIRAKLLESYINFAKGKKGIIYAINKEHARRISSLYNSHGFNSIVIDCDTPKEEREEVIRKFKKGEIQILVNIQIFTEGFDCPDIEFIQLARPTRSLSLYLQQVGRGLRYIEGKDKVIILDNVGMYNYFGLPNAERKWEKHFRGLTDFEDKQLIKHQENFTWSSSYDRDYNELDEEMIIIKDEIKNTSTDVYINNNKVKDYNYKLINFPLCVKELSKNQFIDYIKNINIIKEDGHSLQQDAYNDFSYFIKNDCNADTFWFAANVMSSIFPRQTISVLTTNNYENCDTDIFHPKKKRSFNKVLNNLFQSNDFRIGPIIKFLEKFSVFERDYTYERLNNYTGEFNQPEYFYHYWSLKKDLSLDDIFDSVEKKLTICAIFSTIEVLTNPELKNKFNISNINNRVILNRLKYATYFMKASKEKDFFINNLKSKLKDNKYINKELDSLVKKKGYEGFLQYCTIRIDKQSRQEIIESLHEMQNENIEFKIIDKLDNHYLMVPTSQKLSGILGLLPYIFSLKNDYRINDILTATVVQHNKYRKLLLLKECEANVDFYSIPIFKIGSTFSIRFQQDKRDRKYKPVFSGLKNRLDFVIINYKHRDLKKKYTVEIIKSRKYNFYKYVLRIIDDYQ